MMRRATVLVAVLLASTLTFCVRAGGEDERAVTDRTLDQLGTPARTSDGVKLTAGSDRLRGAVEARGRLDPATLRARWEAAARGDLPESKPHAPSATEEEPSVKSSDELGVSAGEEAAPNDASETPATGEGDSPSEGEEEVDPTESLEVLEVELKELRASADAAEARAKQAREAIELEQLAADVRKTFGDGECKRDDISEPMAYLGDEDTRPGYLVSFGDSKDGEIVANWCRTTGYTLHLPWDLYPDEFGSKTQVAGNRAASVCVDGENQTRWVFWIMYGMALEPPYHRAYNTSHKLEGISPNTIERVKYLLTLTKKHHGPWIEAVTLASNSWDLSRIFENGLEFRKSQWIANASAVVSEIKRHSPNIILRTSTLDHRTRYTSALLSERLNCAMRELSRTLTLPMVDVDECLLGVPPHRRVINGDGIHQSRLCSVLLAGCMRAEVERSGFGTWYGWAFRDDKDSGGAYRDEIHLFGDQFLERKNI